MAGGELNEDSRKLFEWYLANHLEAQQWAKDMQQIYAMSEKAVAGKVRQLAPNTKKLTNTVPSRRLPRAGQISRWAAVIVVLLGIGTLGGRWLVPVEKIEYIEKQIIIARSVEPLQNIKNNKKDGFWHKKMLSLLKPKPQIIRDASRNSRNFWDDIKKYKEMVR